MASDVIIAGGGIAGACAAAALAEFGSGVHIIEPGIDHGRRLAGELIHPPGVRDLTELGLLEALQRAGSVSVRGFAVFAGNHEAAQVLPYDEANSRKSGLAIEHGRLANALLDAVSNRPYVTVWRRARITSIDLTRERAVSVTIEHEGRSSQIQAQLLVAADGRNSHTRRLAGIADKQKHVSDMMGFLVRNSALPHPGFGHVFAGGPSPSLAYTVSDTGIRVMFDLPRQPLQISSADMTPYLDALPQPFRFDVARAIQEQAPLRAANYSIVPDTVFKGRLVCLGDSGGCCHPLTATGLSACTRDALLLRDVLQESNGEIARALPRYASLRREPQYTRLAGARVLYDAFKGYTPEARLMRDGLLRYWRQNKRGRESTMALLSTEEGRRSAMVREYLQVCRYAIPQLIHAPVSATRRHTMFGLSRALIRFIGEACGITQQT